MPHCWKSHVEAQFYFCFSPASLEKLPPDYAVTLLDSLMNLCHYCLLDMVSPVSVGQPSPSSPASDSVAHTNIFTNLWHVFNPVGGGRVSFIIKLHV